MSQIAACMVYDERPDPTACRSPEWRPFGPSHRYLPDGSSKWRLVSVSESNPGKIEGQKTRINTGFSTNGRIGRSPKDSEKERPEGRSWGAKRVEKGVSRPKVCEAEMGENEPITRQNPPLGEAGFLRQRMFR